MVNLAPRVQISEWTCEQIVEVFVPQFAEQFVARFVAVKTSESGFCQALCERHPSLVLFLPN